MDGVKSIFTSKTFWGALVAIASPVVGYFGVDIDAETQELVVNQGVAIATAGMAIVGGVIAIVGRIKAKKTIGSK